MGQFGLAHVPPGSSAEFPYLGAMFLKGGDAWERPDTIRYGQGRPPVQFYYCYVCLKVSESRGEPRGLQLL